MTRLWRIALGQVLQHLLARPAPRKQTLATVDIHAAAVADVQHEELGALADIRVLRRGVRAGADAGMAHQHEQFGGLLLLQGANALEGLLFFAVLSVGPIHESPNGISKEIRTGQIQNPHSAALGTHQRVFFAIFI